jgi:predicted esterase YcpF (UPF0227 family)
MFIYLHGFNSTGQSAKGQFLRQHLKPETVLTPTYPADPDQAIAQLRVFIEQSLLNKPPQQQLILIGSSLGGYYAQFLAHHFRLPVILINPALDPATTLTPYLGWQTNYYSQEKYFFSQQDLQKLARYSIAEPCAQPVPSLLLLDEDDEILDSHHSRRIYAGCADIVLFPGGSHRFEHLEASLEKIRDFCHIIQREKP